MEKGFDDNTKKMLQAVLASSQGQNILKALSRDPLRLEAVKSALLSNDAEAAKRGLEQMLNSDSEALAQLDQLKRRFEQ